MLVPPLVTRFLLLEDWVEAFEHPGKFSASRTAIIGVNLGHWWGKKWLALSLRGRQKRLLMQKVDRHGSVPKSTACPKEAKQVVRLTDFTQDHPAAGLLLKLAVREFFGVCAGLTVVTLLRRFAIARQPQFTYPPND